MLLSCDKRTRVVILPLHNLLGTEDFISKRTMSPGRSGHRRSLRNASKQSLPLPSERLSIIAEDSDAPLPQHPAKTHHRPFSRRWNLGDPPGHDHDQSPPHYSVWDVTGPKGEKLIDVRNNKYVVRRGGWRRLCLLALVVIAVVVALGVGLGIGLRKKNESR